MVKLPNLVLEANGILCQGKACRWFCLFRFPAARFPIPDSCFLPRASCSYPKAGAKGKLLSTRRAIPRQPPRQLKLDAIPFDSGQPLPHRVAFFPLSGASNSQLPPLSPPPPGRCSLSQNWPRTACDLELAPDLESTSVTRTRSDPFSTNTYRYLTLPYLT